MTNHLKDIIDNRNDLLAEKQRLKDSIKMRKANINFSFNEIRYELNPFSAFSKRKTDGDSSTKNFLSNIGSSPIVSYGVSSAASFLLRKVFLKNAGWLPRLVLPVIVKKASEFIVAPKLNNKIVSSMQNVAEKIRETDVEDVLPEKMDLIPDKALGAVSKTSGKIADTLHYAAEKIRPEEKPLIIIKKHDSKVNTTSQKLAKNLRRFASRIRG